MVSKFKPLIQRKQKEEKGRRRFQMCMIWGEAWSNTTKTTSRAVTRQNTPTFLFALLSHSNICHSSFVYLASAVAYSLCSFYTSHFLCLSFYKIWALFWANPISQSSYFNASLLITLLFDMDDLLKQSWKFVILIVLLHFNSIPHVHALNIGVQDLDASIVLVCFLIS